MIGRRPFCDDELTRIFAALSTARDRLLFAMGVMCGFRVSEMLSLTVADVVKARRVCSHVTVLRRDMKQVGESTTSRTMEMNRDVQRCVLAQVRDLHRAGFWEPGTFLFRSRQGGNRAISRGRALQIVHDAAERVGLSGQIGTHSMRKTFANNTYSFMLAQVAAGKPVDALRETAKAGGWKSVETLENYLSFRRDNVVRAVKSFEGRLGALPGAVAESRPEVGA